jgi:hypothetical protein
MKFSDMQQRKLVDKTIMSNKFTDTFGPVWSVKVFLFMNGPIKKQVNLEIYRPFRFRLDNHKDIK